MVNPLDWAKEHPYATAGIVFVGGLVLVMVFMGGGSAPQSNSGSDIAASQAAAAASGNQLAGLQQQLQAYGQSLNAGVATNDSNNATALAAAQLAANTSLSEAQIQADSAKTVATTAANAGIVASTVSAQAIEYTAQQKTLQQYLDDSTVANMGYLNGVLNFLSGITQTQMNQRGNTDLTQGYISFTDHGVMFGTQVTQPGEAPWGGIMFSQTSLHDQHSVFPTLPSPIITPIPTGGGPITTMPVTQV